MRILAPASRKSLGRRLRHRGQRLWRAVLVVQDTPHRVALGFAIGVLLTWLPIVGAQMLIGIAICWLCRANALACIPPIWISNPLTIVPMYWLENRIGSWFVGGALTWSAIGTHTSKMLAIVNEHGMFTGTWEAGRYMVNELWQPFLAMSLGGTILGLLCAIPSYVLVKRAVASYQLRRTSVRAGWRTPPPSPLEPAGLPCVDAATEAPPCPPKASSSASSSAP